MARFIKAKKETIGLSPDVILFQGDTKNDYTRLRMIDFDEDHLDEVEIGSVSNVLNFDTSETTSWFNIDSLHDEKIMQEISLGLELDSLIMADVMNTHSRPKIHEYDNCIYLSVKMVQYDSIKDSILSENLVLIIKEKILLSFQERVGDVFEPVRERIRKNKKRIRTSGTDYLAFALLDVVVDNYIYAISIIGEKIENLDEELINSPHSSYLEQIKKYKSEISYLRKVVKPCKELILCLVKMDSELMDENILVHLKDLQSNIELASDSVDNYREILSDQLSVFHTNVSNKLNDILKFLTIFSVIFIPLTFIAGIYGTNFDNIPELHLKYGYFFMWGVIIITAASMMLYFKRKGWL